MFRWVAKLVTHRQTANPNETATAANSNDPKLLTQPGQILQLLTDLRRHHVLLSVKLPGSTYPFVSSLLEVMESDQLIILDELNPSHGNDLAAQHKSFTVEALLRGIAVAFEVTAVGIGESNGIAYYKTALPKTIHYRQRRKACRIPIAATVNIPFQGYLGSQDLRLHGALVNLSHDGLGLMVRITGAIATGEKISRCKITLPNGEIAQFSLSVCYCQTLSWQKNATLGGKFFNIDTREYKKIQDFLISLERETIKAGSFA